MNTPPVAGFARTRPAHSFVGVEDSRYKDWQVIDRRNGEVIRECPAPQPHNLADAIAATEDCEHCWAGLETVDTAPWCGYCEGEGNGCGECCGDGNLEVCEPCQHCGRLGPDAWISPQGTAEALAGELNAIFSGEDYEPSTGELCEAARRLRVTGAAA